MRRRTTARNLWQQIKGVIHDSADSYLIMDDSVQDKRYSTKVEMVKRRYSGTAHGLVRGIDVVNLVHSNCRDGNYWLDPISKSGLFEPVSCHPDFQRRG